MKQVEITTDKKALTIVEGLVVPDYEVNFQPTYPSHDALVNAVNELLTIAPATTPDQVEAFRDDLSHVTLTLGHSRFDLVGSCHEEVYLFESGSNIKTLIGSILTERGTVHEANQSTLHGQRTAGQSVKPRSSQYETTADGELVLSFFGDGVNSTDPAERLPDPSRMVAMALQSRDITESIRDSIEHHIPVAHEILLLAYEQAFARVDERTDKRYLLSADLPWIGVRTNDPDGPHVALLSSVENAVGVKIGASSDSTHIKRLAQKLNPRGEHGKLIFMLRIGDDVNKILEILKAVKEHAPNALLMFDIHGVTRSNQDGIKVRCVEDVISQAQLLSKLCHVVGLTFIGHHLETTTKDRYECVDTANELPLHPGDVDPRLNTRQLQYVLTEV